jgi:hypothetical protein
MKIETHLKVLAGLTQGVLHAGPGVTQSHSRPCLELDKLYHDQDDYAELRPSPYLYAKAGFLGGSSGKPSRYEHTHRGVTYVMWLHGDRTSLIGRYIGNFVAIEILPWMMRFSTEARDLETGDVYSLPGNTRQPCLCYSEMSDTGGEMGVIPVLRMGRQSDYPAAARAEAKHVRKILNRDIRRAFAAIDNAPPLAMTAEEIDASAKGTFAYPQFRSQLDIDQMGEIDQIAHAIAIKILTHFRNIPDEKVDIMGRGVAPNGTLAIPAIRTRYDDNPQVAALVRQYAAQLHVLLDSDRSPLRLSEQIRRSGHAYRTIGRVEVRREEITAHEQIEAAATLQSLLPDPASERVQQMMARLPDLHGVRCDAYPVAA